MRTKDLRLENTFNTRSCNANNDSRPRIAGDQHEHVARGDRASHQGRQDLRRDGPRNLSHSSGRQRVHF